MITPAHPDDIPAIARMLFDLNALDASTRARFHNWRAQPALQAFLSERMQDGAQVLVYRTAGVPRGVLMWRAEGQGAVLEQLFVEPIWRRRGLGARLIQRFEADLCARGLRRYS
ncbi:GNAT family N-acetyltransferase [Tropicibacter naphthalenivorans]|uniref:N-acetyltransferase domain-containing protein n=1 Tax=Tropicibacter naphthalenivorans TaxID=441103 RepID=A0A0N7M0V1_9RHOB|nr:GNAT family N-acetyltransferase [Tropicibacter naphthalenivorans]CUH81489.1 hypothetical protein TRN7648_03495 [Tropicibacter naphthalenivorans]SMD00172.1 Acetyltransferase (GNAT) domain-containing protein [Tropicibacter naphthalenivorans]